MYVWPKYRFAFLAMPATGSVTVSRALMRAGAYCLNGHHDTPDMHTDALRELGYDHTWTTATTIRPVRDWFTSMFRKGAVGSHEAGPLTLDWIHRLEKDRRWFQSFGRELYWKYGPYANTIWEHGRLQQDVDKTTDRIGAPRLVLEEWNVSNWPHPEWTPEALDYVRGKYLWQESKLHTSAMTTS